MKTTVIALGALMLSTTTFADTKNVDVGQRIYENACQMCHAPGKAKAIHAPAAFDQNAWKARFENAKLKSGPGTAYKSPYDYLLHSIKTGHGLMPHHGLCLESRLPKEECINSSYIAAVKYMANVEDEPTKK